MQYALSQKLWDIPIEATELNLDYEAYKEMRLVCPCCKQPVFLTKGATTHTRTLASGKTIKVAGSLDHFSHFSGEDAKCELKATKIKQRLVKAAVKNLTHDQRFKKLTDRFWTIYKKYSHPAVENNSIQKMTQDLTEIVQIAEFEVYLQVATDWFKKAISKYVAEDKFIIEDIEWIKNATFGDKEANSYKDSLIVPVQTKVSKEILTFLNNKRNIELLRNLIISDLYIGHISGLMNWDLDLIASAELAIKRIVQCLVTIKWLEAFEELEV